MLPLQTGDTNLINTTLDDEPALASRDKLFEYFLEVLRNLFEGTLNGLIFPHVEHLNELFNRTGRLVQLLTPVQ